MRRTFGFLCEKGFFFGGKDVLAATFTDPSFKSCFCWHVVLAQRWEELAPQPCPALFPATYPAVNSHINIVGSKWINKTPHKYTSVKKHKLIVNFA